MLQRRFSTLKTLLFATLALAAVSCGGGGGGASGTGSGTPVETPAANADRSSWGHHKGAGMDWYVSDRQFIATEGKRRSYYTIKTVNDSVITTVFDHQEVDDSSYTVQTDRTDLSFLRKSSASLKSVGGISTGSASPFFLIKTLGTEVSFAGKVARPESARALVAAGGISLVIRNVLNASDTRTVLTDSGTDLGAFAAANAIPTDTYTISLSANGTPLLNVAPTKLAPAYSGDNVGTIDATPTLAASNSATSLNLVSKKLLSGSGSASTSFLFPDRDATLYVDFLANGLVTSEAALQDHWSVKTDFSYNGTRLIWASGESPDGTGVVIYGDGGLTYIASSKSVFGKAASCEIPAATIAAFGDASIPADLGYADMPIQFVVTGVGQTQTINIRAYKSSFLAYMNFTPGLVAEIVTPDKQVIDISSDHLSTYNSTSKSYSTVPVLKGTYYVSVMGVGDYQLGLGVAASSGSTTAMGSNDSPDSATPIRYQEVARHTLTAGDQIDFLSFSTQ